MSLCRRSRRFRREAVRTPLTARRQSLAARQEQLQQAMQQKLRNKKEQLGHAAALAGSLSPYQVLARGYAMLYDKNKKLCTADSLRAGDTVTVRELQNLHIAQSSPWRNKMRAPKTFEDGMARLDTILTQMQSEDTTLAESVKLYAEAASLMGILQSDAGKSLSANRRDRRKRSAAKPAAADD